MPRFLGYNMKNFNLAIIGATGLVGLTFLKVLEEKNIIPKKLYLFASNKSAGKTILFNGKKHQVLELCEKNISKKHIHFALFSAGGSVSKEFAPIFTKYGATVIDNSSAFRNFDNIPLVVPQVNSGDLKNAHGIIANPNCSTIQCMAPLKALDDLFNLKQVEYTTYQAVSGSGQKGKADLIRNKQGLPCIFYPHNILNNCLPHIDNFLSNGYTNEEIKMVNETRKILHKPNLAVSATCVRVPVENCHSVSISAWFEKEIDLKKAQEALKNFESIVLMDNPETNTYPLCEIANNTDKVYVGRVRVDLNNKKCIHMFTVADNIRKGAASNAIEILEILLKNKK